MALESQGESCGKLWPLCSRKVWGHVIKMRQWSPPPPPERGVAGEVGGSLRGGRRLGPALLVGGGREGARCPRQPPLFPGSRHLWPWRGHPGPGQEGQVEEDRG